MKRLIALMISAGIAVGSFAQNAKIRGNTDPVRPPAGSSKTTVVVVPRSNYYSPYVYGYRPYGYPYGYSPFYGSGYGYGYGFAPRAEFVPSKLDLQVEQIRNDYHYEIVTVRHDQSLSKSERRQKIRDLKRERDNAVIGAKQSYFNSRDRY
jgi:hypothetical protein